MADEIKQLQERYAKANETAVVAWRRVRELRQQAGEAEQIAKCVTAHSIECCQKLEDAKRRAKEVDRD